jgi:hypothetical protein
MPEFPKLQILAVENLIACERRDDLLLQVTIQRIQASGVWPNPPLVTPSRDGSGSFIVLDGYHSLVALKEMGILHALVQVVEPGDPGLHLQSWKHLVTGFRTRQLLAGIRNITGLHVKRLRSTTRAENAMERTCGIAALQSSEGTCYLAHTENEDLISRVIFLNAVVDVYKQEGSITLTNIDDIKPVAETAPLTSHLVIFPTFHLDDLLRLAACKCPLPGGVSHVTISPRALHLNYPLDELASHQSLEGKNASLQQWIQTRISSRGVRYYAEATYLFDE